MTESANANIADYYDAETFRRIKGFADTQETPFVVIDTKVIDRQYDELVDGFPWFSPEVTAVWMRQRRKRSKKAVTKC